MAPYSAPHPPIWSIDSRGRLFGRSVCCARRENSVDFSQCVTRGPSRKRYRLVDAAASGLCRWGRRASRCIDGTATVFVRCAASRQGALCNHGVFMLGRC